MIPDSHRSDLTGVISRRLSALAAAAAMLPAPAAAAGAAAALAQEAPTALQSPVSDDAETNRPPTPEEEARRRKELLQRSDARAARERREVLERLREDREGFLAELAAAGVTLGEGRIETPGVIALDRGFLEYAVIGPGGAAHETLVTIGARPSVLNRALLALGLERGTNVHAKLKDPLPPKEDLVAGRASPYDYFPPEGPGVFLYVAWNEDGRRTIHRLEDLVQDRVTKEPMPRVRWVYLGSRWWPLQEGDPDEALLADLQQNLVQIHLFPDGNVLLTYPGLEALDDTRYLVFEDRVPARGTKVTLVLSVDPIPEGDAPWAEPAGGG